MENYGKLIINEFGNGFVNFNNKTIYINKKDIGMAYNGAFVNVEITENTNNLFYGKIINFTIINHEFVCYLHHYYKNDAYLYCPKLSKSNLIIVNKNNINDNEWYKVIVTSIENNKIYGNVILKISNIDEIIENYFNLSQINFEFSNNNKTNYRDQKELNTFTIDPKETQDCDDAFSIKNIDNKTYIYVHISDVAEYVNPTNINFDNIIKRGTTIYGKTKNWTMIPRNLADNICSILPNKETKVYTHEFIYENNDLFFVDSYYSIVISKNKYCYEDSNDLFKIIYDTSQIIKKEFSEIEINKDTYTHEMVKIWMIKINLLMSEKINKLFRCHPISKEQSIKLIEKYTNKTVNNRNDLIELSDTNDELLQYLIKSSLSKAYYDVNNIGHYGLGVKNYTHWTSPIRRSCDLLNHCLIKGFDINISKYISNLNDSEFDQVNVESFIELYENFNKIKVNKNEYNGVIINITNTGISVYIKEMKSKYSIHISKLSQEKLIINDDFTELSNTNNSFKLFDNLKLKIVKYDFINVEFSLL